MIRRHEDGIRVRVRGERDFVVAPELSREDVSILLRALGAHEDTLTAEILDTTDEDEQRELSNERRDTHELAQWLVAASDRLWPYEDATHFTECEKCKAPLPIGFSGAQELCDDCYAATQDR